MHLIDPESLTGSYEDLFNRAMDSMNAGDDEEAEAIFKRLHKRLSKLGEKGFRRRPDLKTLFGTVVSSLGALEARRKNWEEAIALHNQALSILNPDDAPAAFALAQRLLLDTRVNSGETESVVDELRAATVSFSSEVWPWLLLGMVLLQMKEEEEAEMALKQVLQRSETPNLDMMMAHSHLFVLYDEQNRLQEAEDLWLSLMESIGDESREFAPLYRLHLRHDNLERAEFWLREEKDAIRQEFYKGVIARARGDHEAALRHWKLAASYTPGFKRDSYVEWAFAALHVKHNPKRVIANLHYLEVGDEEIGGGELFLLALAYLADGQLEAAHRAFRAGADKLADSSERVRAEFVKDFKPLFEEYLTDEAVKAEFAPYLEAISVPTA